jgi:hypothetical protein
VLLAPPVIGNLAHADLTNDISNVLPCDIKTSACRSFATISSGLCFFFGISVLLHVKRHSSGRTTFQAEDHDLRRLHP